MNLNRKQGLIGSPVRNIVVFAVVFATWILTCGVAKAQYGSLYYGPGGNLTINDPTTDQEPYYDCSGCVWVDGYDTDWAAWDIWVAVTGSPPPQHGDNAPTPIADVDWDGLFCGSYWAITGGCVSVSIGVNYVVAWDSDGNWDLIEVISNGGATSPVVTSITGDSPGSFTLTASCFAPQGNFTNQAFYWTTTQGSPYACFSIPASYPSAASSGAQYNANDQTFTFPDTNEAPGTTTWWWFNNICSPSYTANVYPCSSQQAGNNNGCITVGRTLTMTQTQLQYLGYCWWKYSEVTTANDASGITNLTVPGYSNIWYYNNISNIQEMTAP